MKICLIGPTYPFRGGIAHYTTLLYRYLRKKHDVVFISFKKQYPRLLFPGRTDRDSSNKHIQENGVLPMIDPMNPFTWLKSVRNMMKTKPDLVILPWWASFWAFPFWTITSLIRFFSRSKVLFLCHNVVEHEPTWISKKLARLVLKRGDFFIVHSAEDQSKLLDMLPDAKVTKTFHPTYDVFNFGDADPQRIRSKYGLKRNIILFFGFIRSYKGLEYLIRSLPDVLSKMEVSLLVVGEFWKRKDEYLRLIKGLKLEKNIILVDEYVPNEEVGDYFSASDLVVQPYVEGTGSGVIQIAYGFNKPVIATKVGCLPEVIEDGKTGYLVPPESPHELARAIIKFFRNGNSEEFSKNIRVENAKFSWDRLVENIEDLAFPKHSLQ
ncbi:glycosyltransferase family 4 protein [Thermodesulfobacteriota bacterium]